MSCILFYPRWQIKRTSRRACTRAISASFRRHTPYVNRCLEKLHENTRDPIWHLVASLNPSTPKLTLSAALYNASIPVAEYQDWDACIAQPNLTKAVQMIHKKGYDLPVPGTLAQDVQSVSNVDPLPTWLVLYLIAHKVESSSHAVGPLMDLTFSQLPQLPLHNQAPILILSAIHLATWNLLIPLRKVVDTFLSLPHPILVPAESNSLAVGAPLSLGNDQNYELFFNLFIRSLACIPTRSTAYTNFVVSTIRRMTSLAGSGYAFKVHPETYSALLLSSHNTTDPRNAGHQERVLTPPLASFLRSQMTLEGFTPSPEHLEGFLRFWSKETGTNISRDANRGMKGKEMAGKYWKGVQAAVAEKPGRESSAFNANTVYIGSQGRLKDTRKVWATLEPESVSSPTVEHHYKHKHQPPPRFIRKAKPDIYDLSSALHAAANDMTIPTRSFVALFERISAAVPRSSPPPSPATSGYTQATLATYTILLRGLMFRKDFNTALRYWEYLVEKSGLDMDKMSLTVGLQVLTRCGRPHDALELLEKFSVKPQLQQKQGPSKSSELVSTYSLYKPVKLSSVSITEWMVSLKRISRPDVVFKLWDHMQTLYDVPHTNETLNVLLQSARMAVIMDGRSIRSQLLNYFKLRRARAAARMERKAVKDHGERTARDEALKDMIGVVGYRTFHGGLKPYYGGIWRDKLPEDAAREVFLQILFGMELGMTSGSASFDPASSIRSRRGLANVKAPASSVREGWDSDGGVVGLGVGLPELSVRRFCFEPGKDLYSWVDPSPFPSTAPAPSLKTIDLEQGQRLEPRPHYPHLILNNTNFLNYLSLLAVTNRTTEVALTMAWMREIGLQPSESTLAIAMILWGEVSVEGPLVEGLAMLSRGSGAGGSSQEEQPNNEYERFVWWLEDWVGKPRVPGDEVLSKWRVILRKMRGEVVSPRVKGKGGGRTRNDLV